ncbi:bifunctional diaminohydroxyphosphoribosylaminopyrimidine deaminase/5-amino-6-(5-phosphoribosylamino)uracil reductase RibD [Roseibium denhamense]|uniref:Riboflavin biosynthesis protein RibD n=1 Tax=Roseibium denhamense TaxID=76305 RepID=A0ABY1NVL2_9HYPH|nr:bifunctional diaminohydroxyphosphoribosylaminopyrimidine deaminase/5-amino-6-(5-phosphoribosylamino)uracil reductase RibD [Roseibium denhamense]MTI04816.1 bifunctional diaminohydroxyphosphoribosylaminopyrimidine deaminase/5-amino-6-(5-phosphoribosylamino)uracil reductase RibD [Roseibium denhamense]SMP19103.1 diaminohydroxyphosphoribosylaminopyrimidine deaminase [Roseibium denhamense]
MSSLTEIDQRYMAAAERLARRGLGRVWPNPSVAALIVRDDAGGQSYIAGRGVTSRPGMAHAEVNALTQAGEAARGATCYVTLEPCSHFGRTPPCANALMNAGVKRVVIGMLDPNPRVSGRGVRMLEAAGVEVVVGVRENTIRHLYTGFSLRQLKHRPEVFLKIAVSRDGYIGRKGCGQVRISGDLSMRKVHGFRAAYDAILVGSGTALADDPQLTCRLPGLSGRSPVRVVVDRCARLPLDSKLVRTCVDVAVWLLCGNDAPVERIEALGAAGVNIIRVPATESGIAPSVILSALATRGITRVMVEGGARLASSFLSAELVDDLCVVTGDIEIGAGGISALHGLELANVMSGPTFERVGAGLFGPDRYIYLRRRGA